MTAFILVILSAAKDLLFVCNSSVLSVPSVVNFSFQEIERAVACSAGSPPAAACAMISCLASTRSAGSRLQNTAAPARHATAPMLTVSGEPSRSASTPANSAPSGAMPINIME